MAFSLVVRVLLGSLFLMSYGWAEDTVIVKHYQQQARYEFGLKVLDLALSKLGKDYQIIGPKTQKINEGRGEHLVIEGRLDLEFMSTTLHRESVMIPVKIPIYQGILGLRLLLAKPALNEKIRVIDSVKGLRQFVGGHGELWGDLPVYAENDLKVVTSVHYNSLFKMLKGERFDYFHRGVNEIWDELGRYPNDFVVVDDIMLFYPHPVYFFVSKHRPELAKKIERGLMIALEDKSYKALFQTYYENIITRAKLDARKLIILKNPIVPAGSPPIATDWWLPPGKMPY